MEQPEVSEQEFVDILEKFRDEPPDPLPFAPAIECIADTPRCKALTRLIATASGDMKWERRRATANLGQSLPAERGLYAFAWRSDLELRFADLRNERPTWILYVGKAGVDAGTQDTLRSRYVSEYSKYVGRDPTALWKTEDVTKRERRLSRYLTLRPLEYWFITLADITDIHRIEKKLIQALRPPLNQQYGPRIRPGQTVPAFGRVK